LAAGFLCHARREGCWIVHFRDAADAKVCGSFSHSKWCFGRRTYWIYWSRNGKEDLKQENCNKQESKVIRILQGLAGPNEFAVINMCCITAIT
jgi:hypothetical protein